MSDALLPLPIYPYPVSKEDMDAIKAAKAAMNVDFKVLPRPAVPGSPGRVLALREKPNWFTSYAPVGHPERPESMKAALEWVLSDKDDPRGVTDVQWLNELMPGVREVEWTNADELEATTGVRFE